MLQQHRLAAAAGPDDHGGPTALDGQVQVVEHQLAVEALAHLPQLDDGFVRVGHVRRSCCRPGQAVRLVQLQYYRHLIAGVGLGAVDAVAPHLRGCLLYTSPSPRD